MTEDSGFPEPTEVPDLSAEPEPETPAEPAPDEEAPAADVSAETPSEPPAEAAAPPAELPPFIPDTGVADWLREAFASVHRRLTNLGG